MKAVLQVVARSTSDPAAAPFLYVATAFSEMLIPGEIASRPVPYKAKTIHGSLQEGANLLLQVRWHHYEYNNLGKSYDEVWVGNSSIERALGYYSGDVTITLTTYDDQGKSNTAVREMKAARFFDGTGYWTRFGEPLYNPYPHVASILPAPDATTLKRILLGNVAWKPPVKWNTFDPKTDASGFSPISDSPLKWAITNTTGDTGSPLGVAVAPREVLGQIARFTPDLADDPKADEMLTAVLEFSRQQARRPYHYFTDSGIPYNWPMHKSAMVGTGGLQKNLYSHQNVFGRDAVGLPVPPAGVTNPFNAFDKHHFETDRLAWGYLLTGSRMCLDDLMLIIEEQREYPHMQGKDVDAARAWGWGLRAMAWANYIRNAIDPSVAPFWSGYDVVIKSLVNATFVSEISLPPGPFYVFKMPPDTKHLYPTPEQAEEFILQAYGIAMPASVEESVLYELIEQKESEYTAALALPDTNKAKPNIVKAANKSLVEAYLEYVEEKAGPATVNAFYAAWNYVPCDQISICICAVVTSIRLATSMSPFSALRDSLLMLMLFAMERCFNGKEPDGTFFNDVGAYMPYTVGGKAKSGITLWQAGAICHALVSNPSLFPPADKCKVYEAAGRVLKNNPLVDPTGATSIWFSWLYSWSVAESIGLTPPEAGAKLVPDATGAPTN